MLTLLDLPASVSFGPVGYSVRADKGVPPACLGFIRCLREVAQELGEPLKPASPQPATHSISEYQAVPF
ncbi:MAG: hypothetical protein EON54_17015 [Alcaligenaceae bacterium]|nr:MAG: hypothetical protein EON54_17015 [Alcaligenaceae bacterium]